MIRSRDPTLSSANQFTCRGSGLQVCVQGQSRFKVRTPLVVTRSIHRAFLSTTTLRNPVATVHGHPNVLLGVSTRSKKRRMIRLKRLKDESSGYCATWINQTSALHGSRPGAAGIQKGWKPASLPAGWEMVHGGVAQGERTWHVTMETVAGITTRKLDPAPSADSLVEYDANFRSTAQAGGGYRDDTFEWLKRHSLEI